MRRGTPLPVVLSSGWLPPGVSSSIHPFCLGFALILGWKTYRGAGLSEGGWKGDREGCQGLGEQGVSGPGGARGWVSRQQRCCEWGRTMRMFSLRDKREKCARAVLFQFTVLICAFAHTDPHPSHFNCSFHEPDSDTASFPLCNYV